MINIDSKTVNDLKTMLVHGIEINSMQIVSGNIYGWICSNEDTQIYILCPKSDKLNPVKIEDCFETNQEAKDALKLKLGIE